MLTIRALLPHTRIAGGIRRFLELGNEFVRRGHHYVVFKPDVDPPAWFPCNFHFRPLDTVRALPYDVTLVGDVGVMHLLPQAPSKLRVLVALGDRYASKYLKFLEGRTDTLVIGNSGNWKDYLPGIKGIGIPGGVNISQFSPGPRRPGPFTIAAVGRIGKRREAIPVLLEAFRGLGWKDARVQVITDAPGRVPWRYFWIRRRVEQVLGRDQAALVQAYRDSDVLVTMERTSGWSNPAAEAMACGVPVICTRHGTQDFAGPDTAIVVPDDDVEALARALRDVRERPEEARRRAEAGLAKIRMFEWGRVADGMIRVFNGCLATAGGSFHENIAKGEIPP
jgi:glycosyltransferase involved in cell wall biosynthesis